MTELRENYTAPDSGVEFMLSVDTHANMICFVRQGDSGRAIIGKALCMTFEEYFGTVATIQDLIIEGMKDAHVN